MQFNLSLDKWREKYEDSFLDFVKKLSLEILRRVMSKTPVDTGRAQSNWRATVNEAPVADGGHMSTNPGAAFSKASEVIVRADRIETVFIFNSVPYILELENGKSRQAPRGMLSLSLQEVEGFVNEL